MIVKIFLHWGVLALPMLDSIIGRLKQEVGINTKYAVWSLPGWHLKWVVLALGRWYEATSMIASQVQGILWKQLTQNQWRCGRSCCRTPSPAVRAAATWWWASFYRRAVGSTWSGPRTQSRSSTTACTSLSADPASSRPWRPQSCRHSCCVELRHTDIIFTTI